MRLVNGSNKVYEARVLSDKKVPKFVRGEYVKQVIKIDNKSVEFTYDKQRKTGLYFKLDGKNLYFAERDILVEKSVKIGERANAAKIEEKPETEEKTKKVVKTKKTPQGEE